LVKIRKQDATTVDPRESRLNFNAFGGATTTGMMDISELNFKPHLVRSMLVYNQMRNELLVLGRRLGSTGADGACERGVDDRQEYVDILRICAVRKWCFAGSDGRWEHVRVGRGRGAGGGSYTMSRSMVMGSGISRVLDVIFILLEVLNHGTPPTHTYAAPLGQNQLSSISPALKKSNDLTVADTT
jgi:hypothetical protein